MDTPRPSPRTNRIRRVPHARGAGQGAWKRRRQQQQRWRWRWERGRGGSGRWRRQRRRRRRQQQQCRGGGQGCGGAHGGAVATRAEGCARAGGVRLRGARAALYCPAARGGKRGGVAVSGRRGPCPQRLRCGAGAVTPRDGRRALQLSHGRALCMFCCCRVLRAASHRVYPGGGTLPRAAGRGLGRHEAVGRGVQESPRNVDVSVGGAPRGHASGTSAKLPDCPRVLVRKGRGVRRGMRAGCAGAGGRGVFQGVDERVHVPLQTAKIQADDDVEKTFGLGQSVSPGIRKAFRRGGSGRRRGQTRRRKRRGGVGWPTHREIAGTSSAASPRRFFPFLSKFAER